MGQTELSLFQQVSFQNCCFKYCILACLLTRTFFAHHIQDGKLQYTPDPGFSGTDTVIYTITDSEDNTDTAQVLINVLGAGNSPPVAVDDSTTTSVGTPVKINVLSNDSDSANDPLTVQSIVSQPSHGTIVINPGKITSSHASLALHMFAC
jgi:hypothetical protein